MLQILVERSISLSLGLVFLSNASTLNIHNKNNNDRISTSRRVHTNYLTQPQVQGAKSFNPCVCACVSKSL